MKTCAKVCLRRDSRRRSPDANSRLVGHVDPRTYVDGSLLIRQNQPMPPKRLSTFDSFVGRIPDAKSACGLSAKQVRKSCHLPVRRFCEGFNWEKR